MDYQMISENKGDYYLFKIAGKLTITNSTEIEKTITAALLSSTADIVLDFSAIEMLDSAGIRTLISLHKTCTKNASKFILVAIPVRIQKILESCGLNKVFSIYPSLGDIQLLFVNITSDDHGFYIILKMPDQFNASIMNPVRDCILKAINRGVKNIVIDFSKTSGITTMGLNLLANFQVKLKLDGGGIYLLHVHENILSQFVATPAIASMPPRYSSISEIEQLIIPQDFLIS